MKFFRGIITVALAVSFLVTGTGCSFRTENQSELLEISENYARSLALCDLSEIAVFCDSGYEEVSSQWIERLTFSQGKYYEAVNSAVCASKIAESITYELLPDTVRISDGVGSVECLFSIPDYERVIEDDSLRYVYEFFDALFSEDYIEHSVILEFKLVEDTWVATNYADVMDSIYDFTSYIFSYETPLTDKVLGQMWWYCINNEQTGNYGYATMLDLDILFTSDADFSLIYYTVEYDDKVIKRFTGSTEGYLFNSDPGAPTYTDEYGDVYLSPGDYTITFYDQYGDVLISDVAHVIY